MYVCEVMKKLYFVEKSLKAETSTNKVELRGSEVFIDLDDKTYTSFLEVLVKGENLPYLVNRKDVIKSVSEL